MRTTFNPLKLKGFSRSSLFEIKLTKDRKSDIIFKLRMTRVVSNPRSAIYILLEVF